MRILNLLFTFFLLSTSLFGQDSLLSVFHFDPDTLDRNYNSLVDFSTMYIDSSKSLSIDEIITTNFKQKADFSNLDRMSGIFKYPVWVKVELMPHEILGKDSIILNVPFGFNYRLYEVTNDTIIPSKGGIGSWKHSSQMDFCKFSFPLRILDTIPRTIYIRYLGFSRSKFGLHLATIDERIAFHEKFFFAKKRLIIYFISLVSSILFLGLFFLIRSFINTEKYFLYYGLYLFFSGIGILSAFESISELHIFWNRIAYAKDINFLFTLCVFMIFALYVKHIINIDKYHPLYNYHKFFMTTLSIGIIVFSIFLNLFAFFKIRYPVTYVGGSIGFLCSIAGLLLTINLVIQKNRIEKLIGFGLTALTLGCLLMAIEFMTNITPFRPGLFLEIGYVIEIVFFTLAVGYKGKATQNELIDAQKELLRQEKKNLITQQKLNSELSRLVEEKTKDIITTNQALANQEKLKLEAEFNQKIANAELKALKAQMNPHFIFNCLNAIRNLVQKRKDELATVYLADFASFIRKVLSYSEVPQITLEEELEICELYLKMEQLRFEDGFDYDIQVEPGTAADFIQLPPMLLQPLLENAIWHGLLHKKKNRKLTIKVRQSEEQIICSIDDNGIGRKASTLLNSSNKRNSVGLKLFKDRLDISNQLMDSTYSYEIIDKYQNDKSTGTKVNLYFDL